MSRCRGSVRGDTAGRALSRGARHNSSSAAVFPVDGAPTERLPHGRCQGRAPHRSAPPAVDAPQSPRQLADVGIGREVLPAQWSEARCLEAAKRRGWGWVCSRLKTLDCAVCSLFLIISPAGWHRGHETMQALTPVVLNLPFALWRHHVSLLVFSVDFHCRQIMKQHRT